VMADFVGNHIGLSKIAGGFETVVELTKEGEVEINFLVVAAIEGASGCLREAARRLDWAAEEHDLGLRVVTPGVLENFAPGSFGAAEHAGDELASLVAHAGLRRLLCSFRGDVGLWIILQDRAWIDTEKERDENNRNSADAATGN